MTGDVPTIDQVPAELARRARAARAQLMVAKLAHVAVSDISYPFMVELERAAIEESQKVRDELDMYRV